MICPTCGGCGEIRMAVQFTSGLDGILRRSNYVLAPCPDCIGGVASCGDATGSCGEPALDLCRKEWRHS